VQVIIFVVCCLIKAENVQKFSFDVFAGTGGAPAVLLAR
jgi:hypothetical protein